MKFKYLIIGVFIQTLVLTPFETQAATWWTPTQSEQFSIQLSGGLKEQPGTTVYDIDLFDTSTSTILALKKKGAHVVCYFSAGSYEDWRSDAKSFYTKDLGNDLDDWESERWIDTRSAQARFIMKKRITLAKQKGCDAVDPDNVDGSENDTGFPLTKTDSINFLRFLAIEAHQKNLGIGLKNGMLYLPQVGSLFDFAINEQCHEYNECKTYAAFTKAKKPVYNLEYKKAYRNAKTFKALCTSSNKIGITTVLYPLNLNGSYVKRCTST